VVGRHIGTGSPTAPIAFGSAGEVHEVALHTSLGNEARAKRAVYSSPFAKVLELAGGAALLGAALWSVGGRGLEQPLGHPASGAFRPTGRE
jgi:hypothetical protein